MANLVSHTVQDGEFQKKGLAKENMMSQYRSCSQKIMKCIMCRKCILIALAQCSTVATAICKHSLILGRSSKQTTKKTRALPPNMTETMGNCRVLSAKILKCQTTSGKTPR